MSGLSYFWRPLYAQAASAPEPADPAASSSAPSTSDAPLTHSQEERLSELFSQLDENRDGRVDQEEMWRGVKKLGLNHVTEQHIKQFLHRSTSGKKVSTHISKSEFIASLTKQENDLLVAFNALDVNQDGKLCFDELSRAFQDVGLKVTPEQVEKLQKRINASDKSLDISYEEFRNYMRFNPTTDVKTLIEQWHHDTCMDFGDDLGVPDEFSEEEIVTGQVWRHLASGGVAGAVSRTCTAPLDRLKIFLQVHGGRKSLRIPETIRYMYREGGLLGLWRGNGVNVIKIAPESALKFGSYEFFKQQIRRNSEQELRLYERFLAGSCAGAFSQSTIYPLEVLKTRLALRKTNEYKGIADCAKKLYQREGLFVFYRGFLTNLLGIIPYAGIDLTVYETLKRRLLVNYEGTTPPALLLLMCGTVGSCCGQFTAYPLTLIRTKLQSQAGLNLNLPKEQTHALGLARHILREEGVRGLYRGIIPNFCKVAPAVSISYYVYERSREYLGVEMS